MNVIEFHFGTSKDRHEVLVNEIGE